MSKSRTQGFTLIELVIVVAIVAILAAIAFPSYNAYMQKSRRAQAKADLTEIAQDLERQYTIQRTYVGFTMPFDVSPRDSGSGHGVTAYNVAADVVARSYTLTASVTGPQTSDYCGNLTLDQTGVKHHSEGTDEVCNWGTVGP